MIAVAISGGKDSTAALVRAVQTQSRVIGIFCDTGWESELTYRYLKYLENRLNVKIVRISTWTLPDLIREKRKFPSARFRFCSEKTKNNPHGSVSRQTYRNNRNMVRCAGRGKQSKEQKVRGNQIRGALELQRVAEGKQQKCQKRAA